MNAMPKKKYWVIKSNNLIESRYKLPINEQKMLYTMIAGIEKGDEDFKLYRFCATDLAELWGVKPDQNIYKSVRQVANSLRRRTLDIYDEATNSALNVGWISSSKYFLGEGYVELCFDPNLKPHLLKLKTCFVKMSLGVLLQLRSSYTMRIYELLNQFKKVKVRRIEYLELRGILGIPENKFARYNNFKRKVLLVAQRELKEGSSKKEEEFDIWFDFLEIKQARKVVAIEFLIHERIITTQAIKQNSKRNCDTVIETTASQINDTSVNPELEKLYMHAKEISEASNVRKAIAKAFEAYGEEYVVSNIDYTIEHAKKEKNPPKYLQDSLKEDWAAGFRKQREQKKEKEEEERQRERREWEIAERERANTETRVKQQMEVDRLYSIFEKMDSKARADYEEKAEAIAREGGEVPWKGVPNKEMSKIMRRMTLKPIIADILQQEA